jgi:O-antigen/teichoic acid export membrane protein
MEYDERFLFVLLAGLLGNVIMTLITWVYANRFVKIWFEWDSEYILKLIRISLPYGVALFLNAVFFKIDTILLSLLTESTLADTVVALYSLPMKIVEVGMMYGAVFLNSLLPVLTLSLQNKDTKKISTLTSQSWNLLLFFGLFIAGFLSLFAPEIIRLIANLEYLHTNFLGYTSVDALRIVAWIFVFYFLSSLSTFILIAKQEQKKILYINAIVALVNTVGNILIIPFFSFIGSAYVTLFSQILLFSICYRVIGKNILEKKVFRTTFINL